MSVHLFKLLYMNLFLFQYII